MRTFAYTVIGLLVLAGLFLWGWVEWSQEEIKRYRASKIADMQDSQRGRRPMWRDIPETRPKEKPRVQ